jgi:hypothetical protein
MLSDAKVRYPNPLNPNSIWRLSPGTSAIFIDLLYCFATVLAARFVLGIPCLLAGTADLTLSGFFA